MRSSRSFKAAALVLIIFASALVLRAYGINKYDLWYDELSTDQYSHEILATRARYFNIASADLFFQEIKYDPQPPLYYAFVYAYSFLQGGAKHLRILSLVFGMLALGVFYKLARLLFNRPVSICALSLMAFNPFQVWYSQEARSYSLSLFLAIVFIYFCFRALTTGRKSYWIFFLLAGLCGIYAHYYFVFLFMGSGCIVALCREYRRYMRQWLSVMAAIAALFLPGLFLLLAQFRFLKNSFWLPAPKLPWLAWTLAHFNLGYSANLWQLTAGLILFGGLFLCGAYFYYVRNRVHALSLLVFFLVPFIGAYVFSKLIAPIYITRQLIICSPVYYLFVAQGVYAVRQRAFRYAMLFSAAVLVFLSLANYYRGYICSPSHKSLFSPGYQIPDFNVGVHGRKNYTGIFEEMGREYKTGDILAATDAQAFLMVRLWFLRKFRPAHPDFPLEAIAMFVYPRSLGETFSLNFFQEQMKTMEKNRLYVLHKKKNHFDGIVEDAQGYLARSSYKRVWLISSSWNKDGRLLQNSLMTLDHMRSHYKKIMLKEKDGVYVALFEM